MYLVLSDKALERDLFSGKVDVVGISGRTLKKYDNDKNVIAIAGSRAMAIAAAKMDFPSLKLFQLTSAGFDGVPLDVYAEKGVMVANAGNVYSMPIAETVVFGMLLMAKKLHKNPNNRHFRIQRHYSNITELGNKRVLIMGVGNIGTAIADRLQGFEVEIDGYDPFCPEKKSVKKIWRNRTELLKSMGNYDYIISTMPDNNDTKKFIDRELIGAMKSSAVIVNVGRKAVFDEDDLYYALKNRKIGGAVLDMFEKIPNPITNKFRRLKNVVVLPGVAAISREVKDRLGLHITKNILSVLDGKKAENVINGV